MELNYFTISKKMINKKSLVTALLLSIIILNINAEDAPIESDSVTLKYTAKDVVVESFKQNNNLSVQPISATTLSGNILEQNHVVNIKEVTAMIPNFFMPDYGSKMLSPVYIRGIGSRINAPSVGLYVDGMPYFDRSAFDVNISDVESIEVLRGPQGTIYGRNTMGGIINIFTKSPFKEKGTSVRLTGGNYDTYQIGMSHLGSVNNKIGYSLSGNYLHSGGYFDNITTNKKADPIDAFSTRARLSWKIQPRLTIHLIMAYEYSDQDGYPYRVYDQKEGKIKEIDYNEHSYYRRNMSTNGLNVEYVADDFKLSSQSSFQFFDGKQGLDQDFTAADRFYVDFYQRQQMYSQEFNIKSLKEDSKYTWQFGAFGFHQNYSQNNITEYRTLDSLSIQNVYNPTEGLAVYHQSKINDVLLPHLSFTFGVRYDWEKTKSELVRTVQNKYDKITVFPQVNGRESFSQITPRSSVQYAYGNDGIAYFSVAKGYKTGGFNTTADTDKDRTFDPEHSWSYEVGSKSSFFGDLLHLDLSLFYIKWNDQQVSQAKTTGQGYILRNAGKTVSKGLEFSANVNPIRNLNFQLSYGYTNAKYKDNKKTKTIVYDGNYLPMVPQNTVSIAANYNLNVRQTWLDNIVFNAQYLGVGKLYWNDENDIYQPYYGVYNGKITFMKKQISVDLWTKNINRKDYVSYYFTTSGVHYVQKGKPFTCGVSMNFKF